MRCNYSLLGRRMLFDGSAVSTFAVQKLIWLEDKLVPANLRSEIKRLTLVFCVGSRGLFLNRHLANWINGHFD